LSASNQLDDADFRHSRRRRYRIVLADCSLACRTVVVDGAEVEPYFLDGKIKEIADYRETDVVNTYQVWLRYELFRGRLSESEHQASERSLADFIAARVNGAPHSHRAPEVVGPKLRVREVEGSHRASAPAGKASIDTWVADLLDKPEKTRAASPYELLLV
jgi:hypothetical protein